MKNPIVSIIIPVYNSELYIKRCIDSILHQTFENYEIILINDGSTDNSLEIIQTYKKSNMEKIKIITQENKGTGEARNNGIHNSLGQYIVFIDSDDTIEPSMLEKMYYQIRKDNADIVICEINKIDANRKVDSRITYNNHTKPLLFTDILSFNIRSSIWDKMYKKNLFTQHNLYFPKNHSEDSAIFFKFIYFANVISYIPEHLYNWYIIENSKTNSISKEKLDSIKDVLDIRYKFLTEHSIYTKYENEFIRSLIVLINLRIDNVASYSKDTSLVSYIEHIVNSLPYFSKVNILKAKSHSSITYFKLLQSILQLNPNSILLDYFPTEDIQLIHSYSSHELGLLKNIVTQLERLATKEFYIYGAGVNFMKLLPYIQEKYKILAVIDQNSKYIPCLNYTSCTIDNILHNKNEITIVIASLGSVDEINNFLYQYSIKYGIKINTIHAYDFFVDT